MSDWYFTQLEDGEEVLFGVATSSNSSSSSHHENGQLVSGSRESSESKAGVTNRRVREERGQPGATVVIPNEAVQRVWISKKDFMGNAQVALDAVQSGGERVELGIGFLEAEDEARIRAAFPNAEVVVSGGAKVGAAVESAVGAGGEEGPKKKGLFGFLFGN